MGKRGERGDCLFFKCLRRQEKKRGLGGKTRISAPPISKKKKKKKILSEFWGLGCVEHQLNMIGEFKRGVFSFFFYFFYKDSRFLTCPKLHFLSHPFLPSPKLFFFSFSSSPLPGPLPARVSDKAQRFKTGKRYSGSKYAAKGAVGKCLEIFLDKSRQDARI